MRGAVGFCRASCILAHTAALLLTSAPALAQGGTQPQAQAESRVAAQGADIVDLRGGETSLHGELVRVDDAGVAIRTSPETLHELSWDRVRFIESGQLRPDLEERLEIAEQLWRARSRVERGDLALAEEPFERLFERFAGQSSETALVTAEGLLRCRLARAEHALAVIPALEVIRLRRAHITTQSYRALDPVYDADTQLCAQLPPFWAPTSTASLLERQLVDYDAGDDAVVARIAELYALAAAHAFDSAASAQRSKEAQSAMQDDLDHAGIELLQLTLRPVLADGDARSAARHQLNRRMPRLPASTRAWARFALASSMLERESLSTRLDGLLQLAHVAALDPRGSQMSGEGAQYLAALALAMLAREMQAMQNPDAAASLTAELDRRFPYHPARAIASAPRTSPAQPEPVE